MGYSPDACLSFDVACVEYDERFQHELERTRWVPLASERDSKPMTQVPFHEHATLLRLLGLAPPPSAPETPVSPEAHRVSAMADDVLRGTADWLEAAKQKMRAALGRDG
jgi:hypothetical protein